MRKFSLCLAALFVFTVAAQAEPKAEIFGGYQYNRFEGGSNWNGWNAALTGNMGRFFGVTADFSQVYNSGVHYTTYTFGPEVHALVGVLVLPRQDFRPVREVPAAADLRTDSRCISVAE